MIGVCVCIEEGRKCVINVCICTEEGRTCVFVFVLRKGGHVCLCL